MKTQLRLEAFYTFNERFAKIRSKRISKAVKGIAGSKTSESIDYNEVDASSGKKRKKVKHEEGNNVDVAKEQVTTTPTELSTQEGERKNTKKGSSVGGRGRGRGRGRKQKRKKKYNLELSGTSSSDDENNSDYVQEVQAGHEVRKVSFTCVIHSYQPVAYME